MFSIQLSKTCPASEVCKDRQVPIFLLFDPKIYEYIPADPRAQYEKMEQPVSQMYKGLYGNPKSGYDSSRSWSVGSRCLVSERCRRSQG